MSAIGFGRLLSALAAIVASVTIVTAARPTAVQAPDHRSLAGQLLVASPTISDPRFARSVILMVRHDRTGAFGIIVNLPLDERPLSALLETPEGTDKDLAAKVRIFVGGPVQPEIGFVVHSAEYRRPETMAVSEHVAVTSSREILRDIAGGKGPRRSLIAFGYAGWGPGQLEGEIARGGWVTTPADSKLIFDEDRDKVWDLAYARRTQDL